MNKKLIIISLSLLVFGALAYVVATNILPKENAQQQSIDNMNGEQISEEEKAFNESGRAKAIEDEKDLWMYYEDKSGFSIKYPSNVSLGDDNSSDYSLSIKSVKIDDLDGTLGFDKETALKNETSLSKGEYGESVDFSFDSSRKLIKVGDGNAQDYVVFSRFEACSVIFERTAYFFNNGYLVTVTLRAPKDKVVSSIPEYFKTDKANCGNEQVWNFDKQKEFYSLAKEGKLGVASEWLNTFDEIVSTIQLKQSGQSVKKDTNSLLGKWVSLDDANSAVEFNGSDMIDYYQGSKVATSSYKINGTVLVVISDGEEMKYEILELTDEKLVMSYLARGNTLTYKKSK
jgi:hypothetical protein